jgi:hypothetical protein
MRIGTWNLQRARGLGKNRQEIALMGNWIRDSLLVRWAELAPRLAIADARVASQNEGLKCA